MISPSLTFFLKEVFMRQVLSGVLSVLFVIELAGVSMAGMMDTMKGQAQEASTDAHKGMDMKESGKEAAIEAQSATKEEVGGMMDQLKEGAKGEVNEKGKEVNETIDNIGK
jgi:hypothetical protein